MAQLRDLLGGRTRAAGAAALALVLLVAVYLGRGRAQLVAHLPGIGLGAVGLVAVVLVGWRYLRRRRADGQARRNAEIAAQGRLCLVLPPRGEKAVPWKTVRQQGIDFAAFLAATLAQFPSLHISLEIVGDADGSYLQVWAPEAVYPTVIQGLMSAFPEAQLRDPADVLQRSDGLVDLVPQTLWAQLAMDRGPVYPLKGVDAFATDSLAFELAALARSPGMGRIGVQIVLKDAQAVRPRWNAALLRELDRARQALARQPASARAAADRLRLGALEEKAGALGAMAATVRVFAEPASQARMERLVMALRSLSQSAYNHLVLFSTGSGPQSVLGRHFDHQAGRRTILSPQELAPLWHEPRGEVGDLRTARGVDIPPPPEVVVLERPPFAADYRVLGCGVMRDGSKVFVIWPRGEDDFDANVHFACVGATGSGKTTLIANLVAQDTLSGRCGDIVLEPHRSLTLDILKRIPPEREASTIWVNPTGRRRTFGLNPLDYAGDMRLRPAVGDSFVSALEKIIGGDWDGAVRMRRILNNVVQAILEGVDEPTMLHLMAFLRRETYRDTVIEQVRNPEVSDFWREEFADVGPSRQQEMLGPVFTRLSPLLLKTMTRQVVGQARTTLPFKAMMDAGLVTLIDVSAKNPEVGDDNAAALGTLLLSTVWGAAASRVKGFYPFPTSLWIDEFHLFVTRDIESMMAEARGFGLGVYVATQYWSQLPGWMQEAIMNNTWTKLVGRVNGPKEARLVARIFPGITPEQILTLGSYTYLAQVSANKQTTMPFTLKTFPPLSGHKLRRAYQARNQGGLARPSDHGAIPHDFFSGVTRPDAGDRAAWRAYQTEMEGMSLADRAEHLADMDEAAFAAYRHLQRGQDLEAYERLRNDPTLTPQVALTPEEEESLGPEAARRVRRIRALSSLQVETPRDIVMAEDRRLRRQMDEVASVYDELLL